MPTSALWKYTEGSSNFKKIVITLLVTQAKVVQSLWNSATALELCCKCSMHLLGRNEFNLSGHFFQKGLYTPVNLHVRRRLLEALHEIDIFIIKVHLKHKQVFNVKYLSIYYTFKREKLICALRYFFRVKRVIEKMALARIFLGLGEKSSPKSKI